MNPAYAALLRELRRARRVLLWRSVERAGVVATFGLVALAVAALLVALLLPLHRSEYVTLRSALLLGAGFALVFALVRVLRSRAGLPEAALEASRLIHESDDGLLTAFELGRSTGANPEDPSLPFGYSDALTQHAVRTAADRAASLPLRRLRAWRGRSASIKRLGIVVALLAAVAAIGGSRTVTTVRRIADPEKAPLAPIRIRVEPGSEEVEGGASVPVRVTITGTERKPRLLSREGSSDEKHGWRERTLERATDEARPRNRERAYATVIRNLNEDLVYQVRAADQVSPVYRISVRDLPRASGFRIRYEYPAYCGQPSEATNAITGDLVAPRGTRARVEVLLNRSVGRASLQYESGAASSGELGERLARFVVPVRADARYRVRLVDPRGRKVDLGPYDIKSIPDRPPTVTIVSPSPVEDVTRDLTTTILAGATDDYGVKKILLRYRVRQEPQRLETLHQEADGARELAVRYTWSLASYNLLPGEEIEYEVGAEDGNQVDGPQTTWSETRTLRFPSAAEILSSVERQQDESVATLEDAIRSAKLLREKSDELARDLGRARELPWEKGQDIQKTLEGQQALREQIDKVAEKLGQDADKLAQSRALNAELVQKLTELHQLLNELHDQSILRAMQRVQEALKKMSPQDLERAMQNMKLTQEDVVRNLERTIELLKQIKMEEKLEAAAERAADMARRQLALNDSLARARQPNEMKDLAKGEKEIREMGKEQRAALDSLAAELKQMDRESAQDAESQRDRLQSAYPVFEKAVSSLQDAMKQEAKESTQDLQHQLEEMRNAMNKMKEDFVFRKKNDVGRKMDAAIADLLEIADAQEDLLDDPKSGPGERASTQQGLEETTEGAANRIGDLSKRTLFITPEVMEGVGRALSNQKNAVGRYSMEDLIGGLGSSKEATIALNQAASALLKGRDAMAKAKSSTGFQEAMQMLQSLAGDQQKLNGESLSLLPGSDGQGQQGRPRPDPSGELGRMAAEQEAIRRGLEEAMEKMGQGGGTLGQLGQTGEDMKKVAEDLRGGRLDQETVERQQRILSRLLDAPRSVEKRDYSRRRTSRPGVDVVRSSPGALSPELLKARPSLAALLARGGRDPVSPRYRALVDQYFQALLSGKMR